MILSVEERDQILAQLNEEQRQYLADFLVRGHRTIFANVMAKEKGFHIPEDSDPAEIEGYCKTGFTLDILMAAMFGRIYDVNAAGR
ncbi:hypothetical protein [Paenibacillus sp. MMO-177]|uniref:hypothetical protein n=1 Tax=Paenibacillus sp. MMO-177 TaxID=3081289 RepID=UPI003018ED13